MNVVSSPSITVEFLRSRGALLQTSSCCEREMSTISGSNTDGIIWRCPKCRKKRSIRHGSFFARSRLPLGQLVLLIYLWSCEVPYHSVIVMTGYSTATVTSWLGFVRGLVSSLLIQSTATEYMIGGPGTEVEIDETMISKKQKSHVGTKLPEVWLFGGVERKTGRWFAEIVEDRSRATLTRHIITYIRPATKIISDKWASYVSEGFDLSSLEGQRYLHESVNHSEHFKDPKTGACTNTIEGNYSF